ncbi:unnamed protein product [Trichobilharzia regenti]|nr:unnamed protein product [Trichobilharzia regenti]
MSYRYLPSLIRNAPRLKTRGIEILRDPRTNKGSSYSLHERQLLGIHGLLPPSCQGQDVEEQRIISNLYQLDDHLSRYMMLMSLQDRNEKLFYKTVRTHLEYCLPLIYTPTVGSACLNFGFAVIMTDGERILGFGDLGANGMAIPLSKAILYVALGGVQPLHCLPIMLDVGTNNEKLLEVFKNTYIYIYIFLLVFACVGGLLVCLTSNINHPHAKSRSFQVFLSVRCVLFFLISE